MALLSSARCLAGALVLAGASVQAEIQYTVTPIPDKDLVHISMTVPVVGRETVFKIPHWSPGHYALQNNWTNVRNLAFSDAKNRATGSVHTDDMSWRVPGINGGMLHVDYDAPVALVDGVMHYNGPILYLYVDGRKNEECQLTLSTPKDWRYIVALDNVGSAKNVYAAKTYDVLADSPVTMGDYLEDRYTVRGKTHIIAMRGKPKAKVDRAKLIAACKAVSTIETDFFGEVPYHEYVWNFSVNDAPDGAGGLEHLAGTEISLASGVGPRAVSVLAHEFFHLWNVKRIRSRVLGPFDYTQLPQTGALWWLEGVTDYYAHTLLPRYGYWTKDQMYAGVVQNVRKQTAQPGRLEAGPYESSFRVRDAANGRGNGTGYKVNYYDDGWLVGLCLDLELISRTHGRRSLDDVTKALWKECRNSQPGFEEGEIRNLLVKFGGPSMGDYYDTVVMKPGELPVNEALTKAGISSLTVDEAYVSLGLEGNPTSIDKGYRITKGTGDLATGSLLVAINDVRLDLANAGAIRRAFEGVVSKLKAGETVTLKVADPAGEKTVSLKAVEAIRKVQKLIEDPAATVEQKRTRDIWTSKRK